MKFSILLVLIIGLALPAYAQSSLPDATMANVQLSDPAKERAAKDLMESIRCVVCQGQSIADSNSFMAENMRALIRQRIENGENAATIRAWLVERYGKWVTYDTPTTIITSPIWVVPILAFILGTMLVLGRFRVRRR